MNQSVRTRLLHLLLALWAVGALATAVPSPALAQEGAELSQLAVSDTLLEIRLSGGESYIGRVVQVDGDRVALQTDGGTRVELSRAAIASVRTARGRMVNGSYWREDPNHTRLFFSPTARPIPRGTGYFGVYEIFIPFVGYGLTDQISIAGGSPFYLGLTGDFVPPFYIAPKVQVLDRGNLQGSVGALALMIPEDDTDLVGILYGVMTAGSNDNALTGGIGWGYVGSDISSQPVVMVGGETRIARSVKLLSENVFVPGEAGSLLSLGVRFFGERLSADAGLMGLLGDGGYCCFPVVNFVWGFGDAR